jgi:hypothetical protein
MGDFGRRRIGTGAIILALVAASATWLPPVAQAASFGGFSDPLHFSAGSNPADLASADFNGDSDPDLAVANSGDNTVSILLGGPGGTFSGPTDLAVGHEPESIAIGDFNGDSDPDLAVVNSFSSVSILLGKAGASFSEPTNLYADLPEAYGPWAIAVGDFNADSDPDLAVAFYLYGIAVLLGGPDGSFGEPTYFASGNVSGSFYPWIAVGDLNGDSDPDLATGNLKNEDVNVLLGGPGGSFGYPTSYPLSGSSVSGILHNFNRDRTPDLAVTADGGVELLLGNGAGGFGSPIRLPSSFRGGLTAGRFDRNAHADIAVAGVDDYRDGGISILLGNGKGVFGEATSFYTGIIGVSSPVVADDFNGDSRVDLATSSYFSDVSVRLQVKGKR